MTKLTIIALICIALSYCKTTEKTSLEYANEFMKSNISKTCENTYYGFMYYEYVDIANNKTYELSVGRDGKMNVRNKNQVQRVR